jgi:hypothetical protein
MLSRSTSREYTFDSTVIGGYQVRNSIDADSKNAIIVVNPDDTTNDISSAEWENEKTLSEMVGLLPNYSQYTYSDISSDSVPDFLFELYDYDAIISVEGLTGSLANTIPVTTSDETELSSYVENKHSDSDSGELILDQNTDIDFPHFINHNTKDSGTHTDNTDLDKEFDFELQHYIGSTEKSIKLLGETNYTKHIPANTTVRLAECTANVIHISPNHKVKKRTNDLMFHGRTPGWGENSSRPYIISGDNVNESTFNLPTVELSDLEDIDIAEVMADFKQEKENPLIDLVYITNSHFEWDTPKP